MRRIALATVAALMAIGVLSSASAQSNNFIVDCNRGQKISTALELGDFRKPVVINVRGTCSEFLRITRDDVTLRGDPAAEFVAQTQDQDLVVVEANGVTLENLTLTGGSFGVRNNHGFLLVISNVVVQGTRSDGIHGFVGDARIMGSTIRDAGGAGVYLARGASATISGNCEIVGNAGAGVVADRNSTVVLGGTIRGNGTNGVQLQNGSHGSINGGVITENGAVGLNVGTGASATVTATTISGNGTGDGPQGDGVLLWGGAHAHIAGDVVVADNRDEGVDVAGGASAYIIGAEIARNGGTGILGYMGAGLGLGNLVIEDNGVAGVYCSANCTAQMENMSIHGNAGDGINLSFDSTLMLVGPPIDVAGNGSWGLYCHDAESSVTGMGLVTGTISPTCTGFE